MHQHHIHQSKGTGMTIESDQAVTVGALKEAVHHFVEARDWYQYHTPKNLAMCIAIEAAEIMEHFQWQSLDDSAALMADEAARAEVADELADVLIYCLSFANSSGIDVSAAIHKKLARNEVRFPVEKVKGRR
jgi:NTP pyrophosphatase (non-canonical NTP hydrolase)